MNFFQFIFSSTEDKDKVAAGHNWIYENQYLVLKEWFPGLVSNHGAFDEVKIWVQVLNVPLNWMCTDVGVKIGRIFKGVKNVNVCKLGGALGSFIKILAVINTKEPIPRCTTIKLGDQRVRVAFRYERLINLCYYCGYLGHLERNCKKKMVDIDKDQVTDGQFGEWLKTSETFPGGRHSYASNSGDHQSPPFHNSNVEPVVSNSATPASVQQVVILGSSSDNGTGKVDLDASEDLVEDNEQNVQQNLSIMGSVVEPDIPETALMVVENTITGDDKCDVVVEWQKDGGQQATGDPPRNPHVATWKRRASMDRRL
ncbi:Unknown protein [Striga hermonthica]|uniref:CCHC-type domain-containing protein n=1 Tax=Striga hermonthica TaxID=68872 RepID=A0A9N7NJA6_STRHE|nr:Unknown protein [Striga hermonthica]